MPAFRPFEALRPFLWIAFIAFLAGFSGYLVLSGERAPAREAAAPVWLAADDPGPPRNI
jgi:tryptophan-rich sensory protein